MIYKGYTIDIYKGSDNYRYIIKKDEKLIVESINGWPFPTEAEMQAKLYVNRLLSNSKENKSGWMVS